MLNPAAHEKFAEFLFGRKEFAAAENIITDAWQCFPGEERRESKMADLHLAQANHAQALKSLERLTESNPGEMSYHRSLETLRGLLEKED